LPAQHQRGTIVNVWIYSVFNQWLITSEQSNLGGFMIYDILL